MFKRVGILGTLYGFGLLYTSLGYLKILNSSLSNLGNSFPKKLHSRVEFEACQTKLGM